MRHHLFTIILLFVSLWVPAATPLLGPATGADNLAAADCRLIVNGDATAVPADVAAAILGFDNDDAVVRGWHGKLRRRPDINQDTVLAYLLVLNSEAAVGTIRAEGVSCRYLRPGGTPDPLAADQWLTPPVDGGPGIRPLPAGTKTRAILATLPTGRGRRNLVPSVTLLAGRVNDLTPLAIANAESEYTVEPDMGPPFTLSASNVIRGRGKWQNTGPDKHQNDRVPRPPISDVAPCWFVLSWDKPHTPQLLVVDGTLQQVKLYAFVGDGAMNPAVASDADWRLLRAKPTLRRGVRDATTLQIAFPPIETRGLKLVIQETTTGPVATIERLLALEDLGERPVPIPEAVEEAPPAFTIPYQLEKDGEVTMVIEDAAGNRVRNLMARRQRQAGAQAEPWDLQDNAGHYVAAGTYRWRAIWHPQLVMRYEMTPFPNIGEHAPENAPWLTGHSGTGGWLADHTAPVAACPAGDRMFLSAPCAEGGVGLIETDLQGRKLWGHHDFMAWTAPERMTANAATLYVHAYRDDIDHVWTVDLESRAVKELLALSSTSTRRRGMRGMVVRDDELYCAVRGPVKWLNNAFSSADVDIAACWPKYKQKEERDRYAPDLREDFMRIFRLTGTPPGQRNGLTYIETAKGPERRQHVVLACNRDVPVGTLVFPLPPFKDLSFSVSVLKPTAPYPPDPEREADWQRLDLTGRSGWTAVTAPPATRTRALRITFTKGVEDALSDVLGEDLPGAGSGAAWSAKIEGMKILRRRYEPCPAPSVEVNSGNVSDKGVWDAHRQEALSADSPGIYLMKWPQAQSIRGLAIREIDGKETQVDVFTGPAGAPIDLEGDANWEQVATYTQARRYYYQPDPNRNVDARYMDGYVDFGREVTTRAVRLRVVSQYTEKAEGRAGLYGVREDRGGLDLDAKRCRVYGVLALRYLGGEVPVDPLIGERLEVFDAASGKLRRELPLDNGGDLALGPDGALFGLSGKQLIRIDTTTGAATPVITDLEAPTAVTVDAQGRFYVFDKALERQVVRVYGADGTYQRDIGTPGGFKAGAWDPTRTGDVTDLAIDSSGQLWAVEHQHHPKRTTRWKPDGTFAAEHFGRTIYGGGGVLDPRDKSLLYYGPLEFELNWQTGHTRLKSMTSHGDAPPAEQPVYMGDRKYLVSRESFFRQPVGVVYRYENGVGHLAAAIGLADQFKPLRRPEVMAGLGGKPLAHLQFMWSDLNGDETVQPDEVTFADRTIRSVTNFDPQLGLTSGNLYWEVAEIMPNGVPRYEQKTLPLPEKGEYYRLANGNFFSYGEEAVYTPEGKLLWRYPTEGTGVHAFYRAKPLTPEQVVSEFSIIGHGIAKQGDLGEYVVTSSNSGIWHIWTVDGLLAGNIFRDLRDPLARHWSMLEHERGMVLPPLTAGQEHFWGNVTLTNDGRTYGIWMSTNVFSIEGMDQFKRLEGTIEVTDDALRQVVASERRQQQQAVYREAKVYSAHEATERIAVDGNIEDWDGIAYMDMFSSDRVHFNAQCRLTYDANRLCAVIETVGMGPFKNTGEDPFQLFKTGACVDLMLGTNPAAASDRQAAVAGDLRLLIAPLKGKPTAVLYEAVVPGIPDKDQMVFATMVFRTVFSRVRVLTDAEVKVSLSERGGYIVEFAVPLKELGLAPKPGELIKFDWGVLRTDDSGNSVLGRHYWCNQATSILSDVAAEAELTPALWGHLRFMGKGGSGPGAGLPGLPGVDNSAGTGDEGVDKLLNELEEEER